MSLQAARRMLIYYAAIVLPIGAHIAAVFLLLRGNHDIVWSESSTEFCLQCLQLAWLLPTVWAMLNLIGLLRYGPPTDLVSDPTTKWNESDVLLVFCYVSRGDNCRTLTHSVTETKRVADRFGVPYAIEVLTDTEVAVEWRVQATTGPIWYRVVPESYRTQRGARFKARALQYGLDERKHCRAFARHAARRRVWLLHLDEESVVTSSAILGVQEFVTQNSGTTALPAIGQGEIVYNGGDYGSRLWIAAIDAIRTGDDLGRFRLQYRGFQRPLFGMHGSFVLVSAEVEAMVTWDLGASGSITEDAAFALRAMQLGVPFGWVSGIVQEQSPFSIRDIIQQRRRWLTGLSHVASSPQFSWQLRLPLALLVLFWKLSWLATAVVVIVILAALSGVSSLLPLPLLMLAATVTGIVGATYIVGAYRNVLHSTLTWWKRCLVIGAVYVMWLCLIPAFVEGLAVLVAVLFPADSFHVVDKNVVPESTENPGISPQGSEQIGTSRLL